MLSDGNILARRLTGVSTCPSPEVLARLGTGWPGDASNTILDDHVNGCDVCQMVLDRLAREAPVTASRLGNRMPPTDILPEISGYEIADRT
jgi:hypothetical protein